MNAIIKAICRQYSTENEWIEGVAGCAMKKTVASWSDSDMAGFPAVVNNIARRLNAFESLIHENSQNLTLENFSSNRSVVSVTLPNGEYFHESIDVDSKIEAKLQQQLKSLNLDIVSFSM